ncbi:MAG: hypothetical protein H7Y11_11695 [Armatimonadetes bacterium]|nr:hypothetical protein [Anaerolineae bacterium]
MRMWHRLGIIGLLALLSITLLVGSGALAQPDDGRINYNHGDLIMALYALQLPDGTPYIQGYCINRRGRGLPRLVVSQADVDAAVAKEDDRISKSNKSKERRNALVKRARGCKAVFYVLSNGQYQVNLGPDNEGKTWVVVFDGFAADNVRLDFFNIYGTQG